MTTSRISYRRLAATDEIELQRYFDALSPLTRSRFGPHPFDASTTSALCQQTFDNLQAWVAWDDEAQQLAAYLVIKPGYLHFEEDRYRGYGLRLDHSQDYTLAPSVADDYQSQGIGKSLMAHVLADLRQRRGNDLPLGKVLLWGGCRLLTIGPAAFTKNSAFACLANSNITAATSTWSCTSMTG